jgi:hypothetical protein
MSDHSHQTLLALDLTSRTAAIFSNRPEGDDEDPAVHEDYRMPHSVWNELGNPESITVLVVPAQETDQHVIEFRADGWTIQHPLACRPNLFDCPFNRVAERDLEGPPAELGRFPCRLDEDGRLTLEVRASNDYQDGALNP